MSEDLVPIQPWDRQPKEGVKAFEAFVLFRDLGVDRGITRVASELGKSRQLIDKWAHDHFWNERVYQYDIELDRRRRARREQEQEEMLERHRALSGSMATMALRRLVGDEEAESPVQAIDPNLLDAQDVVALAKAGMQSERMAFGLPTDITKASYHIDPKEAEKLLSQVVDIGLRFCPPDDQEAFMREIRAVAAGTQ